MKEFQHEHDPFVSEAVSASCRAETKLCSLPKSKQLIISPQQIKNAQGHSLLADKAPDTDAT